MLRIGFQAVLGQGEGGVLGLLRNAAADELVADEEGGERGRHRPEHQRDEAGKLDAEGGDGAPAGQLAARVDGRVGEEAPPEELAEEAGADGPDDSAGEVAGDGADGVVDLEPALDEGEGVGKLEAGGEADEA